MRMLYDNHVSLLLTGYDAIKWGGAENKLGFLPADKQDHLKKYSCSDDFLLNREHLLQSVKWFAQDIQDVSERKGQKFDTKPLAIVQENWERCTSFSDGGKMAANTE